MVFNQYWIREKFGFHINMSIFAASFVVEKMDTVNIYFFPKENVEFH